MSETKVKKERKNLDLVTERYGPFEKWQVWACIIATFSYFVTPYIVSFFIAFSPSLSITFNSINTTWYVIFQIIVQYFITFAVVIGCFGKYIFRSFKLFFSKFFRNIGILVVLFIGALVLLNLLFPIFLLINPQQNNANQESIDSTMEQIPILMWIVTVIVAPVCEEVIFRWGLFRPIYKKSPFWAHFITVLLFCFVHVAFSVFSGNFYELANILLYMPISIALSLSYSLTGSFFAPILLHMVWNAMA